MNSLMRKNHTLQKFFNNSKDTFFGRTIEDMLNDNFFDSFDANMREEQGSYKLEIAVPGWKRNDITIRVDGGVMWVSGQRQHEKNAWRAMEFTSANLQRSFTLPSNADTNNIKARCRNGLLTIQIGKLKSQGAHRVIPVSDEKSNLVKHDNPSWWTRLLSKANRMLTKNNHRSAN